MKSCPRCGRNLPLDQFTILKTGPRAGRVQSWCRTCQSDAKREQYARDPAVRQRRLQTHKAWLAANPEKREAWARAAWLRRRYGMTIAEYDSLLATQNGVCAACGGVDQNGRRLAVDHCHDTGRIRGLLCDFCNRAVGLLRNDPATAEGIARYLKATG